MASSTAGTYLFYKPTPEGTFQKLVDIINYPDLGATPSKLDTTTLSALKFKTSILGLQEIPDLTFECNYDKEAFTTISALTDSYEFQLRFGDEGSDGAYGWTGQVQIYVTGGGVDEVRKMQVVLSAETPIEPATIIPE